MAITQDFMATLFSFPSLSLFGAGVQKEAVRRDGASHSLERLFLCGGTQSN